MQTNRSRVLDALLRPDFVPAGAHFKPQPRRRRRIGLIGLGAATLAGMQLLASQSGQLESLRPAAVQATLPVSKPVQFGMYVGGNSDPVNAPTLAYPGTCARERWLYNKPGSGPVGCVPDANPTNRFLTLVGGQPGGNVSDYNVGGAKYAGPPPTRTAGEPDTAYRARVAAHVNPQIEKAVLSHDYALRYDQQFITEGAAVGLERAVSYMTPMSYKSYVPRVNNEVTENERYAIAINLAEGANPNGMWKAKYEAFGRALVNFGIYNAKMRAGWEMDGNWFAWQYAGGEQRGTAAYATNAANWKAFYRNIHDWMTNVANARLDQLGLPRTKLRFEFIWNPSLSGLAKPNVANNTVQYYTEDAWPGDDVVDTIGLEAYCGHINTLTYPESSCFNVLKTNLGRGLDWYSDFAAQHGNKPIAFPEWTVTLKSGDDVGYIEQMAKWIKGHNVAWFTQFDASNSANNWRLCPSPYCNPGTSFPKASAAFKTLFSQNMCNNGGTPSSLTARTWTCSNGSTPPTSGVTTTTTGPTTTTTTPSGSTTTTTGPPASTTTTTRPPGTTTSTTQSAPSDLSLSIADGRITEPDTGYKSLAFKITMNKASKSAVSVKVNIAPGTATPKTDYDPRGGGVTIKIPAGQTVGWVGFAAYGDNVKEPNETVAVTLSNVTGATVSKGTATGTIVNDD